MWTPGVMEAGQDGVWRAYPKVTGLLQDSSIESLIVCARTVQAIRDSNACFTTETERRNPQTDVAECAHACGAGRQDADRRCPLVFTGNTSMLHRQRFCKSRMSRPGCLFLCVCTCVCTCVLYKITRTNFYTGTVHFLTPKNTNHLLCFHKYLFTFLLNKIQPFD